MLKKRYKDVKLTESQLDFLQKVMTFPFPKWQKPPFFYRRAEVVLLLAQGLSNREIMKKTNYGSAFVYRVEKRFYELPLELVVFWNEEYLKKSKKRFAKAGIHLDYLSKKPEVNLSTSQRENGFPIKKLEFGFKNWLMNDVKVSENQCNEIFSVLDEIASLFFCRSNAEV